MPSRTEIFDAVVRYQVILERAKAGTALRLADLLRDVDEKIIKIISDLPVNYTHRQQLLAMKEIKKILNSFYGNELKKFYETIAIDTVDAESWFSNNTISFMLDGAGRVYKIDSGELLSLGYSKSYQGHKLSTWYNKLSDDKVKRIRKALRDGRINELKKDAIIANARKQFGISNKHSETIMTAYINNFSNLTRDEYYKANPNAVETVYWSSILDSSTTEYCIKRNGKQYDAKTKEPIGHKLPWLGGPGKIHFGCRSIPIPLAPGDLPLKARKRKETNSRAIPVSLIIRGG